MAQRDQDEEWLPVLQPRYARARTRHARFRVDAYELARLRALDHGLCGPGLRLTDIDEHALKVWDRTWRGTHPSGTGSWNWPGLVQGIPRRAAVIPIAIWYGDDLCGLAVGHASRRRWNGDRHTVTLGFVERRPEPPDVPLRGHVIAIAGMAADQYGVMVGARRLCLRRPDRNLLHYYERQGFAIAWKGGLPVHCEREIRP